MALSELPTPTSHDERQLAANMEAPLYQTYPQDAFAYGQWTNAPTLPVSGPDAQFDGMWGEEVHAMTTSHDMPTMFQTSNNVAWSMQESAQTGGYSQSPTSPVVYQGQDVEWNSMPSQDNSFASGTWTSNDHIQPVPSPLSEALSFGNYTFNHRTPSDYEPQTASIAPFPQHQDSESPAAPSAPPQKSKAKGKGKAAISKLPKKADESSKSRTSSGTKRKSPAPSTKSSGSASGDNSKPPPFLGIFPPDIDPREASANIQRQAWERCKTEAMVMSRRRLLLLDHERGALERETQKLQDNLALMREAAAREHGQLKEAVKKAEMLNARGYY